MAAYLESVRTTMYGNDHTDDDDEQDDDYGYGENRADDMTSEEIRAEALDMLAECDGAVLVTASLDPDDPDAAEGAAVKFVSDRLTDEDRHDLHDTVMHTLMHVATRSDSRAIAVDGDELGGALLRALMGAMDGPDPVEDDDEDDRDDYGGMYA